MAWIHIEDTAPPSTTTTFTSHGKYGDQTSTQTHGHSIYRCYSCKALATGKIGDKPAFACGKCGARP